MAEMLTTRVVNQFPQPQAVNVSIPNQLVTNFSLF